MPVLRVALGTMQQQIGISCPVLESNYNSYHCITKQSWVKHIWKFLHEVKGRIVLEKQWLPQSPYKHDVMIMERVTTTNIPTKTISKFNQCRLQ